MRQLKSLKEHHSSKVFSSNRCLRTVSIYFASTPLCTRMNREMAESNVSRPGSSDMLWGFWYPALRSEQVRRHKLVRAMLLDVPLVLGRDAAGKPFALRDVCPHRAFPLSFGQFDGKTVECAYHGWQF